MQVRLDKEVSKMLKAELKLQRDCNANPKSVYAGGAVSASSIANYIVWKHFHSKQEEKKPEKPPKYHSLRGFGVGKYGSQYV